MNDLPIHTKFSVRLFVENTILFIRNQNLNKPEKIVSTELLRITDWTRFNRLSLNFIKTYYIIIPHSKLKHKADNFKISICGSIIVKTDSVHYLGLHLQSDLNLKTHIDYVYKKIPQAAGISSKIRRFVNKKT